MAMGVYLGAGSVKELKSCYVGAGGVKTVNAIYVGAGSVKQVWPAYTDYGGDTVDLISNSMIARGFSFTYSGSRYVAQTNTSSTYIYTGYSSATDMNNIKSEGPNTSFSNGYCTHWYETTKIDTRGYNYIMMQSIGGNYSTNSNNFYICPGLSYYTSGTYTWDEISPNLKSSSSTVNTRGFTSISSSYWDSYAKYILYDISNLNEEAIYIFFGGVLSTSSSSMIRGNMASRNCMLYKSKPSGADITLTY